MKKLFLVMLAAALFTSCKKENTMPNPDPAPVTAKKLMKFVNVYNNGTPETETYTYDAKGRVATLHEDGETEVFNYESATSLIVRVLFDGTNTLRAIRECTLNDKGYITKMVIKNDIGVIVGTYEYMYNSDGYLTNQKLIYPSGSTMEFVLTISDGNVVSAKLYYDNVLNSTKTISYDFSKTDKTQISYLSYWNIPGLFGKGQKNLKTEFKDFDTNGILNFHVQYSYELDAAGYPKKQINRFLHTGKEGSYTYTYQ